MNGRCGRSGRGGRSTRSRRGRREDGSRQPVTSLIAALIALCLMAPVALLAGCGDDGPGGGATPTTSPAASMTGVAEAVVLSVSGPADAVDLTVAQIEALPSSAGWAGMKTKAGKLVGPDEYTGVTLVDLADVVGGVSRGDTVAVSAADGYRVELTYGQLQGEGFVAYDADSGAEARVTMPLIPMLVYARTGVPLDAQEDGRLQLQIAQPEAGQLVDARWAVRDVVSVDIRPGVSQ